MPNKTLYIRDADEPVWDAASRVARRDRVSLSQLVTEALETHLPKLAEQPSRDDRWAQIAAEETPAA